jgi:hypothetical protein
VVSLVKRVADVLFGEGNYTSLLGKVEEYSGNVPERFMKTGTEFKVVNDALSIKEELTEVVISVDFIDTIESIAEDRVQTLMLMVFNAGDEISLEAMKGREEYKKRPMILKDASLTITETDRSDGVGLRLKVRGAFA